MYVHVSVFMPCVRFRSPCPQGDVWICMELMDHSLHQLYKLVYETLKLSIPEDIVGKMAESVSQFSLPF